MPPRLLKRRSKAGAATTKAATATERRPKPKPAAEVISLLEDSTDDDDDNAAAKIIEGDEFAVNNTTVEEEEATAPSKRKKNNNGAAAALPPTQPRSEPCSPPSTATTQSKGTLAGLLAGSVRPPAPIIARATGGASTATAKSRPPTGLKQSTSAATAPAAAGKRKGVQINHDMLEQTDEDDDFVTKQSVVSQHHDDDLWTTKYVPRTETDLIVHKKKVEEVRHWMSQQAQHAGHAITATAALHHFTVPAARCKLVVVNGPPGCGKSVTLETLAIAAGLEIQEWHAAAQSASFEDVQQQRARGNTTIEYESKLSAFESFVEHSCMPSLALQLVSSKNDDGGGGGGAAASNSHPQQKQQQQIRSKLVVVDDLPHASGIEQRQRLARALGRLARSARFPVALIVTTASNSGKSGQDNRGGGGGGTGEAVGGSLGLHKDLLTTLEAVGAPTISFNPITVLNTEKALRAILDKEQRVLPDCDVRAIAQQAAGDLRNAISTLQFACTGVAVKVPAGKTKPAPKRRKAAGAGSAGGGSRGSKKGAAASIDNNNNAEGDGIDHVSFLLRDTSLSIFHGLGKLLYNKRLPAGTAPATGTVVTKTSAAHVSSSSLQHQQQHQQQKPIARFLERPPMDGFDPEAVLIKSGLQAGSVTAFLHENLPHFVEDTALTDLVGCLTQLSASDVIASGGRRALFRGNDSAMADGDPISGGSTLSDAAAASVAARGVCFWNSHPAPRSWQPLKAPEMYVAQRGATANGHRLEEVAGSGRILHGGAGGLDSKTMLATEMLPYLRQISAGRMVRAPVLSTVMQQPAKWSQLWKGKLHDNIIHSGGKNGQSGGAEEKAVEEKNVDDIEDPGDDW